MKESPKILAFAGSARMGSYNKMLARIAADAARDAGAEITFADLQDYPMPIYDFDLESRDGIPEFAVRFKKLMIANDGFLISSPENNSTMTTLLKNVIDWASRRSDGESPLAAFDGKVAAIMSVSTGGLGGLRGLVHLRAVLENMRVLVLPDQKAVPNASTAFDSNGGLVESSTDASIRAIATKLTTVIAKLKA